MKVVVSSYISFTIPMQCKEIPCISLAVSRAWLFKLCTGVHTVKCTTPIMHFVYLKYVPDRGQYVLLLVYEINLISSFLFFLLSLNIQCVHLCTL